MRKKVPTVSICPAPPFFDLLQRPFCLFVKDTITISRNSLFLQSWIGETEDP
ncbi:hypothetical protein LptCag_1898 [Leptospirillum ferriphilum]|uniref:Uncharacterized protein n=1 Tax=Leptospirillum ferriphilum TaxID=178606 RepID=A0A094W6V6_9BACT|nr:hypothetical protein LptCag_1898 [Leptospirillum ferriphilum]